MQAFIKFPTLVLFCLLCTSSYITAQLVRNTGSLNIAAGGYMYVDGSFENGTGGTPAISGTLDLTGDFTNNGADLDAAGTGTTRFSGSTAQNISGPTSTSFYNLSKPNSNTVIIGNNETIKNTFTLTAGFFQLNDHILTLNGTITGAGFLTGSASSGINIGSSGPLGTLLFDQTTDTITNALKTLSITNGGQAVVGNLLNIVPGSPGNYGTITVTGATGNLDANANLILRSNSLGDARVAESTGSITDTAMVERYIPLGRAWRFINVPFSASSQSINASWMEGAIPNPDIHTRNNPKPGYGLQITYWHSSQASGFDENTTENPSIRTWDVPTQSWGASVINTLTTPISDFPAYYLFIRGDRSVDLALATNAPPTATTLRAKGILNETGGNTITSFAGITTGQRFFAGNRFASAVRLLDVLDHSTNVVNNKFWVWNPKNVSAEFPKNVGNYVTYANGVFVPVYDPGDDDRYEGGTHLQSGQAFMAEASGADPTIVFQQSDKEATEQIVFGLQPMQQRESPTPPVIYTNLMSASLGSVTPADGVAAGFGKKYAAVVDADDAAKMWNQNESMALIRDEQPLAIEFRPVPEETDTLFYRMYLYVQPYTLRIFSANLRANLPAEAWLIDKYLQTETPVDLYDTTEYSFTPTADTNTYKNRFMLVFNRVPKTKSPAHTNNAIDGNDENARITFYPNPVSANQTTMRFSNMAKGSYEIAVYNNKGEKLAARSLQHEGNNTNYTLPVSRSWTSGVYNVKIINKSSRKTVSLQLVVNR